MWQPIETAPKDGTKVDIWVKVWRPFDDSFVGYRIADTYWCNGDSISGKSAGWKDISYNVRPTHWMEIPKGPDV